MHYEAFCGSNINFKDTINVCKLIYSRTMTELKPCEKKLATKTQKTCKNPTFRTVLSVVRNLVSDNKQIQNLRCCFSEHLTIALRFFP